MTLYRQLLLFILTLFLVLFCGMLFVKLQATRSFLQTQLESHAQDTATSLGLSIAPYVAVDDMATAETMINAIFDRGYYQSILVKALDGSTLIEKRVAVTIDTIPGWFVGLIPLDTPRASILLSSSWQQLGHIYVKSHPGYAYDSLWRVATQTTQLFILAAAVILICGVPVLRLLFNPLKRVEEQAEALCNRQYTVQKSLPVTKELRRVVTAMNSMVVKVRQMFDEQAELAENMRKSAYIDPLSGLGNRRYFEQQLKATTADDSAIVKGALLLAQFHDLTELNQEKGYESGDLLLLKGCEMIKRAAASATGTVARISGGTVGIILPDATYEEAERISANVAKCFAELASKKLSYGSNAGNVGTICFERSASPGRLLSEADRLLRMVQSSTPNDYCVERLENGDPLPQGEQKWVQLFNRILQDHAIILLTQKAVSCRDSANPIHLELLSRISMPGGDLISANVFIPLAEQLGKIGDIDRIVVEKAFSITANETIAEKIAINLSVSSLNDSSFVDWICSKLKERNAYDPAIIFEFTELAITASLELAEAFHNQIKKYGASIGIDHFGRSFANFGYLNSLQPEYVKIDKAFTEGIASSKNDSHFFIQALAGVAHSIDILVIAEGVETQEQLSSLCSLGIDGVQGYYIGNPEMIETFEK